MTAASAYRLPEGLAADIDAYEDEVRRFLAGEMPAATLRAKRVPRGVYEQRRDGAFMVRVRLPGGVLPAAAARAVAAAAAAHGSGTLHLTSRQDVQIHDVPIAGTPRAMRDLLAADLTSKGGGGNTARNVSACPFAGVCPREAFDVTPFAAAVTAYLIPLVGSYNLPRKYKVAFEGCAAGCALGRFADLGFFARREGTEAFFTVYAGGGMGAQSRLADLIAERLPPRDAVRAAEAVRRIFDRVGDRRDRHHARLRFAVEKMGAAAFRRLFEEEMRAVAADGVPDAPDAGLSNPPAAPARAGGETAPPRPPLEETDTSGLRFVRQRQEGFVAVSISPPFGLLSSDTLSALADLSERFGTEKALRLRQSQDLSLRFVRAADLPGVAAALRKIDPALADAPVGRFVSCAGAATCRLGLCLSRGATAAVARAVAGAGLSARTLEAVDVRVNGCPNACGQHPAAAIGAAGGAKRRDGRLLPSYRLFVGARRDAEGARLAQEVGEVPARRLPEAVTDLLRDFEGGRSGDEDFAAYVDRSGLDRFRALVAARAALPSHASAPEVYRDWGADEDFSLAGRGAGECGAGVFDLIRDEIASARRLLAQGDDRLVEALAAAAGALLVVRGADARTPGDALRAFDRLFVETGLVGPETRGLLSRGLGALEGWRGALDGRRADVARLVDEVDALFGRLDSSLEFRGAPAAARPAEAATPLLDLGGVACPMNFVKAKLRLEAMEVGEALDVVLDDGEPIRNVPASLAGEGQEIVETAETGGGRWRIRVKKKR